MGPQGLNSCSSCVKNGQNVRSVCSILHFTGRISQCSVQCSERHFLGEARDSYSYKGGQWVLLFMKHMRTFQSKHEMVG